MANLGIPELFVILFIILLLLGTPALVLILILALRRAAGGQPVAAASPAAPSGAVPRAAGRFDADGSTMASSGGLRALQVEAGVFLLRFDGYDPARRYVVNVTPLALLAGEPPAVAEVLEGEARQGLSAAGIDLEQGVLIALRFADGSPAMRQFMVEIIEVS